MINQIFTIISTIFDTVWTWAEGLLKSIDAYQVVLSVASIAIISRFLLYPIFRGGVTIRANNNSKRRTMESNND